MCVVSLLFFFRNSRLHVSSFYVCVCGVCMPVISLCSVRGGCISGRCLYLVLGVWCVIALVYLFFFL